MSIRLTACLPLALAASLLLPPTDARAQAFTLGAFDSFGLLVNTGVAGGDINTFPVNANIGVGNITGSVNLHNGTINGRVDVLGNATSALSGRSITGTQPVSLGGAPPAGSPASVNSNVALVGTAISNASTLSTSYGAKAGSGTPIVINGSTTLNASAGFLDITGARLFTAASFSIGNGNTVVINGTANDYVVINITGGSGNRLNGAMTLTGGITSKQVLVNFIGSGGNLQGAANGATLSGTFLAPNLGIQLNSLVIDGHLFGGASGTNFQFVSNARINQPALAPVSTPEPASFLLLAAGLGGIAFARRNRAA